MIVANNRYNQSFELTASDQELILDFCPVRMNATASYSSYVLDASDYI